MGVICIVSSIGEGSQFSKEAPRKFDENLRAIPEELIIAL
jgi:hypothetical protein